MSDNEHPLVYVPLVPLVAYLIDKLTDKIRAAGHEDMSRSHVCLLALQMLEESLTNQEFEDIISNLEGDTNEE